MFAVYSTPSQPIYAPQVVYSLPRRSPVYQEAYLNAIAEAQLARQRYAEEQRALAAWRAQQEAIRQEEHRRRQANALHNNLNRRRLARSYVLTPAGYITVRAPASYPPLWDLSRSTDVSSTTLPAYDADYETEFEAFRRRKAQQARTQYLNQLERERKKREDEARAEHISKQLAAIERIRRDLPFLNRNEDNNIALDKPIPNPAKFRKVEDSDSVRKAAIHNARTRFMETLQTLASQFNTQVSNPSYTPEKPSAFTPAPVTEDTDKPRDFPAFTAEYNFVGPEQHMQGAKLRRRREIAARTIQRRWRSHSADVAAAKDALNTINVLSSRLQFLQSSFILPEYLKFREDSTEKPILVFSSENAPVNTYVHELDKLLSLADGIPSAGNERVRSARKMLVKSVEEALEKVETLIQNVWNRQKSTPSETVSIPISGSTDAAPIESTVDATSHLGTATSTSLDTSSSGAITQGIASDVSINDPGTLSNTSSLSCQQDDAVIIPSTNDVNSAKVSEADAATNLPVLVDISPNTPTSHFEDTPSVSTEANAVSISVPDAEAGQNLYLTDALATVTDMDSHCIAADINLTIDSPSIVLAELGVSSSAERQTPINNIIEVHDSTALQTVDIPVPSDLINNPDLDKEEEVAIDHANLEAQKDTAGNEILLPEYVDVLDSAAINERYPLTSDHVDTSLYSGDKLDVVSETTRPLNEASNPTTDTGEDRDPNVQASIPSDSVVPPEAGETSSQVLELELDSALDAVQSAQLPTESILQSPDKVNVLTDVHSTPSSVSVSIKANIEDSFDVVYPDSPIDDSLLDTQRDAETASSDVDELEARSSNSDGFELL